MKARLLLSTLSYGLITLNSAYAVDTSPIPSTNALPIMEGSGLSQHSGTDIVDKGRITVTITGHINSHANDAGSDTETLIIDGEVYNVNLQLNWGFTDNWHATLNIKGLRNTSGHFDNVIDTWHDLFGLDKGDRSNQNNNQLLFLYTNNSGTTRLDQTISAIGDIQIGASRKLLDTKALRITANINSNIPVGSSNRATGSEKADYSAFVSTSGTAQSLGWHANLGILRIGDNKLFGVSTKPSTWFSSIGTHWQAKEHWRLSLQADSHGTVFDSDIDELKQTAWQLSLAGEFTWPKKNSSLQLYFTEDLSVNRAADFSFGINYRLNK